VFSLLKEGKPSVSVSSFDTHLFLLTGAGAEGEGQAQLGTVFSLSFNNKEEQHATNDE
jgi:hypothetical protein